MSALFLEESCAVLMEGDYSDYIREGLSTSVGRSPHTTVTICSGKGGSSPVTGKPLLTKLCP